MKKAGAGVVNPSTSSPSGAGVEAFEAAEQRLVADFSFFDSWEDRYRYLIDLGEGLAPFPDTLKTEENRLKGCQSQVWFVAEMRGDRLYFQATSDAAIVKGLVAVVLQLYSGRTPETILTARPQFVEKLGLAQHLSPTRASGLASMLQAIRNLALRHVAPDVSKI